MGEGRYFINDTSHYDFCVGYRALAQVSADFKAWVKDLQSGESTHAALDFRFMRTINTVRYRKLKKCGSGLLFSTIYERRLQLYERTQRGPASIWRLAGGRLQEFGKSRI